MKDIDFVWTTSEQISSSEKKKKSKFKKNTSQNWIVLNDKA